jgi:hypothetical protein
MTSEADPRRVRLTELYERGLSCREIGRRLGISREWVRLLLARYEIPAVPISERRYLAAVRGREAEIAEAFLRLRNDAEVAGQLGLRERHVRRLVSAEVPDAALLRRPRRTPGPRYSDQDLIAALREAAPSLASPMGHDAYRRWARGRDRDGRPWPGTQVAMRRFGGWRRALLRAGLPTNRGGGPPTTYSLDDVIAAIAAAWRELGRYPSVARYDAWRAGRAGVPSPATARCFAASWDDLLVKAYPLVHGLSVGVGEHDRADSRARATSPAT